VVVHILVAQTIPQLSERKFVSYINMLPSYMQTKVLRYKRWEDAQASLLGKLLLLESFNFIDGPQHTLADVQYSGFHRPFINNSMDFNISHSGNYVVCAISEDTRLGIDVEEIKSLQLEDFQSQFSQLDWNRIIEAENSCHEFYNFWTKKEALIKADGRVMHVPLCDINVFDETCVLDNKTWHTHKFSFSPNYAAHLATESQDIEINIVPVTF